MQGGDQHEAIVARSELAREPSAFDLNSASVEPTTAVGLFAGIENKVAARRRGRRLTTSPLGQKDIMADGLLRPFMGVPTLCYMRCLCYVCCLTLCFPSKLMASMLVPVLLRVLQIRAGTNRASCPPPLGERV